MSFLDPIPPGAGKLDPEALLNAYHGAMTASYKPTVLVMHPKLHRDLQYLTEAMLVGPQWKAIADGVFPRLTRLHRRWVKVRRELRWWLDRFLPDDDDD
jgi:hypothetical protein